MNLLLIKASLRIKKILEESLDREKRQCEESDREYDAMLDRFRLQSSNLKAENDEKSALRLKHDQLVESYKLLEGRMNDTVRSYEKLQYDHQELYSRFRIVDQDYCNSIKQRKTLRDRVYELESQLESQSKRRRVSTSPNNMSLSPGY